MFRMFRMLRKRRRRCRRGGAFRTEYIPLSFLRTGQRGMVVRILCGRGLIGRIASMGFTPGTEVKLLQNYGHGPLIARVRDARLALGRGEANKIIVRIIADTENEHPNHGS